MLKFLIIIAILAIDCGKSFAEDGKIIRDIETENFLKELATPILIQANLAEQYPVYNIGNKDEQPAPSYKHIGVRYGGKPYPIMELPKPKNAYTTGYMLPLGVYSKRQSTYKITTEFILVESSQLNAWVSYDRDGVSKIFVTTGLIMAYNNTTMLIDIIAHEIGHIAGKHLILKQMDQEDARQKALVSGSLIGLVSLMAGAGGAAAGSGIGAAIGGAAAGSGIGMQSSLAFSQSLEKEADLRAMKYLEASGISTRGMYDFMSFASKKTEGISEFYRFFQTHPLSQYRMQTIENFLLGEDRTRMENNTPLELKFQRIQAKIRGFYLNTPFMQIETKYSKMPESLHNKVDFFSKYQEMYEKFGKWEYEKVIEIGEKLIYSHPGDIYIAELLGQAYCALSNISKAREYLSITRNKIRNNPVLEYEYGACLIRYGQNDDIQEAVKIMNSLRMADPYDISSRKMLISVANNLNRKDLYAICSAEIHLISNEKNKAYKILHEILQEENAQNYPMYNEILSLYNSLENK